LQIMSYLRIHPFRLALFLLAILFLISGCSKNKGGVDVDDNEDNDKTPPAAVADLRATYIGMTVATICWTAPGDDGNSGYAYQYDLRASFDSITDGNFGVAHKIDSVDTPYPGGTAQCYDLDSLTSGQKYYFALKTRDFEGNWSDLSNCISLTCRIDSIVVFPDSALERVVRQTIAKPSGDIMRSDLQSLTELWGDNQHITNLTGIQYCSRLIFLHASSDSIPDLTPLQNMMNLRGLVMTGSHITDLTPLAGLTDLEQLIVGQNPITDLTPLSGLTKLNTLFIHYSQASDFSAISNLIHLESLNIGGNPTGNFDFIANLTSLHTLVINFCGLSSAAIFQNLTELEYLNFGYNQISDLSPLSGLTNLSELDLRHNSVSDILPLVNNAGLATGDQLHLQDNPLSDISINTYIPALEARGVTITR
jgi:Leucine-rich repeat (LRR) protein